MKAGALWNTNVRWNSQEKKCSKGDAVTVQSFLSPYFIWGPNSARTASQVAPTVGVYPQGSLQDV